MSQTWILIRLSACNLLHRSPPHSNPTRLSRRSHAKKSQDKDAALSETMLRDLESLKQEGSGAYPPKLAELARLSGQSPSDEQVQKAANKKTFTAKAVVIEKVDKKPSLDSPVYIKRGDGAEAR